MSLYDVTAPFNPEQKGRIDKAIDFFSNVFGRASTALGDIPKNIAAGFTGKQVGQTLATQGIENEQLVQQAQQTAENVVTEGQIGAGYWLNTPYRELIARPLSTAFLVMNENYRANKNVALNPVDNYESKIFTPVLADDIAGLFDGVDTWKRAYEDSKAVSPLQAFVGYIGSNIDGSQGTDYIDYSNEQEVASYFDHGIQRVITGVGDGALSWFADPVAIGAGVAGAGVRRTITVPITPKNQLSVYKAIDDAIVNKTEQNGWSIQAEGMKRNSEQLGYFLSLSFVNDDINFARQLQAATRYAIKTGDDSYIADALKIGYGDTKTLDKVIYDANYQAQEVAILAKESEAVRKKLANMDKEPISSTPLATSLGIVRRNRIDYLNKEVQVVKEKRDVLDQIAEPTELKQRQTVSQFDFIERQRVRNAENFYDSYWTQTELPYGMGRVIQAPSVARLAAYLRPGSMLREKPANYAVVGGLVGDYSHYEFAARVRQTAELTGKTPKWSQRVNDKYLSLKEKDKRIAFMDNLETKSMTDILVKELGNLTPSQRESAVALAQMLAKDSRMHRRAYMEELVRADYTIRDGTGDPVVVAFLKEYEDAAALEIAKARTGQVGAKPTPEDIAKAKEFVIQSLKGQPVATVQIPNVHFSIDLLQFRQLVKENSDLLFRMVDAISNDPRYKNKDLSEVFKAFVNEKSKSMFLGESIPDTLKKTKTVTGDFVVDSLDTLYNRIWKPQILASLHYTSRNVTEGWGRSVAMAWEFSADTGIPFLQVISGAFDQGVISRALNNNAVRVKDKVARIELDKFKKEIIGKESEYTQELFKSVHTASDSIFVSNLTALVLADDIVTNYGKLNRLPGTRLRDEVVDSMSSMLYRLSDEATLPEGVNPQLFSLVFKNDGLNFFKTIASVDERYVSLTLSELQKRFKQERANLLKFKQDPDYQNLPPQMKRNISEMEVMFYHADLAVASTMTAAMAKAQVRGQLNKLIGDTDVLNNIQRFGEGEFEFVDGLTAPDIYRGVVGEILRNEISMVNSTTATIFNLNRATTGRVVNGILEEKKIAPYTFDEATGEMITVPEWAAYAADRANREFRDALTRKIAELEDPLNKKALHEVYRWARYSQDPEAIRWRREMSEIIKDMRNDAGFQNPIKDIVARRASTVAGLLPSVGTDGRIIRPLLDENGNYVLTEKGKKIPGTNVIATESGQQIPSLRIKALAGELTVEDMLAIPDMQRQSVVGTIARPGLFTKEGLWNRITNVIFKWIGSLPEDAFVRHPTARMLYQAEFKRIGDLWLSQGRSLDYIQSNIGRMQESAYRFAYKGIMTRLYSVQRYTDPAYTLRFISPFYMAKQNSNRFWFGYAMRNPKAAVRYFTLWSAPNRIFDVENENGETVEGFVNPFMNQNVYAMMGIPNSIADALGIQRGQRFMSPQASWDLINNGFFPFAPEPGGPLVTATLGNLLPAISGKPYDPELLLTKMGYDPEVIRKAIVPYYQTNYGMSPQDTLMAMLINPASWLRTAATSSMAEGGFLPETLGELIDPKATERFNTLMIKNFRYEYEQWVDNQDPTALLTAQEQTALVIEMMAKSASYAANELTTEATWSFAPTIGNVKIESYVDRKSKELRILQQKYGYEQGKAMFIQQETKVNAEGNLDKDGYNVYTTATFTPRETNKFGLTATPQTLNNIRSNQELFDILSAMQAGSSGSPDTKVLGALFNGGDRVKDYSLVANEKLYREGLKKPSVNDESTAIAVAVDSGWDEYFALTDYYNSLALGFGVEPGTKEFKESFGANLDADIDALSKRNPLWANESGEFNLKKADVNTQVILGVLGDEKFMKTVGKNNKLIDAVQSYFVYRKDLVNRRLALSDNLKTDIYRTSKFDDIVADKEYIIEELSKQVPEFREFATYYLRKDPLFTDGKIVGE